MKLIKLEMIIVMLILVFIASCAPPPDAGGSPMGFIGPFLPFVLIIILFYFLIIRPQSKQQNAREDMLKSLKKGTNIINTRPILKEAIKIGGTELLSANLATGKALP